MIQAYPLQWPLGYSKTKFYARIASRFDQTPDKAQDFLRKELQRLGAVSLIISSNVMVRKDGYIYSDMANSKLDEPGVAIYFKYNNRDVVMCCDRYSKPWENLYALAKGIEAIRSMERWGVSDFIEKTFTGFTALPEASSAQNCWQVLGFERPTTDKELLKKTYRILAKERHPDGGGSSAAFQELNTAYQQALNWKP